MCECLHSGDNMAGTLDKIQVGGSCHLDPMFG